MNVQNHINASRKQLAWAWQALEFEDYRGATGRAWEAAVEATKAIALSRNLDCQSSADVYGIAYKLMDETKDKKMDSGFTWASTLHTKSLQDYFEESDLELGIKGVADYVEGVAACLGVGTAPLNDAASNSL